MKKKGKGDATGQPPPAIGSLGLFLWQFKATGKNSWDCEVFIKRLPS